MGFDGQFRLRDEKACGLLFRHPGSHFEDGQSLRGPPDAAPEPSATLDGIGSVRIDCHAVFPHGSVVVHARRIPGRGDKANRNTISLQSLGSLIGEARGACVAKLCRFSPPARAGRFRPASGHLPSFFWRAAMSLSARVIFFRRRSVGSFSCL